MQPIKKYIPFLLMFALLFVRCTNHKLVSKYISTCSYMGEYMPMMKLTLDKDSFMYINHMNDSIYGKWTRIKDTIILTSPKFLVDTTEYYPNYQYNDTYGQDKYLVRKDKLLPITKNGKTKRCFFIESSKWKAYKDKQFGR